MKSTSRLLLGIAASSILCASAWAESARYTPVAGDTLAQADCVLDSTSGLIWERKASQGLRAATHTYRVQIDRNATEAASCAAERAEECTTQIYVRKVNDIQLCGYSDWRMPTQAELHSLLDFSQAGPHHPAIDMQAFPDTRPVFYWTNTRHRVRGVLAVWFDDTHQNLPSTALEPSRPGAVRLVRGPRKLMDSSNVTERKPAANPAPALAATPRARAPENIFPSAAQFAEWRAQYARYQPGKTEQAHWPAPTVDASVRQAGFSDLGLLPPVPFPANNPYSAAKAELGRKLFIDTRLSRNNQVACISCHNPKTGWSDKRDVSLGHIGQRGLRNSMSIINSAYVTELFWDGRAKSLEEQSLGPIPNPLEMHQPLALAVAKIAAAPDYAQPFKKAFGDKRVDAERIAQALATFERTITSRDSAFDRFLKGDKQAMSDNAIWGLHLFRTKARCINCHNSALFSDNRFHNNGLHYLSRELEDKGRADVTGNPADIGKFRTPSLRDIMFSGNYMHNGLFPLTPNIGVIGMYDAGMVQTPLPGSPRYDASKPQTAAELKPLGLSLMEKRALFSLMEALSEEPRSKPATVKEMKLR